MLQWFAAVGTIVAAGLIASDRGRRVTGWAFVLFVVVAVAWIVAGLLDDNAPIALQNLAMVFVNGWGVWQYLLSPKKKREIKRAEQLQEQAHEEVKKGQA
ncbi:hypothetical protein RM533_02825 [Croceicoccus sp. F390]|uniref:Uncharacterized protein n=1 Tax=Croceicoccus esteveae TaxID=3075597 RepID=A0ABU2ZI89_9SPHN|nr:hypothetical protein [Croceicoccus sp. F390]MDT0575117.1 hypothetical protein [Croceicoccus sp. F390]